MNQREVLGLIIQVVVLAMVPVIVGIINIGRRCLSRAKQPVPGLMTAALILMIVVGVLDATGIGLTLTSH